MDATMDVPQGVTVRGEVREGDEAVLTRDALAFLADLHRRFDGRRRELLEARTRRQAAIDDGERPGFLEETREVREGSWQVAPPPKDLVRRRVEITGPTDRKMVINALNSGADGFMADFEDANAPTWANMVEGQVNLQDAVRRSISFEKADGTRYELDDDTATLMVRARGLHLDEAGLLIDGEPIAGSLFDAGLYLFHNARELVDRGTGPYFYLPKLEGHLEARWWDDVFVAAEEALGLAPGTVKATVLIEHVLAALEMEEILYELRDHSAGLNAGRWDYIFSLIKTFRLDPDALLPDRGQVTMTVPFMRAYTELLVRTCHKRGAHAIGGMAAFIPSKDPEVNAEAFDAVRSDKRREATDGFDGTWVAHPGLIEVAREEFDRVLEGAPNQVDRLRDDVEVTADDLLTIAVPDGRVTEAGLRQNVGVGLRYVASWLSGRGAAAIFNLMEDTATAEISRAQVWQWVRHGAPLDEPGGAEAPVTADRVRSLLEEEVTRVADEFPDLPDATLTEARDLFEEVALSETFHPFLTIPGLRVLRRLHGEDAALPPEAADPDPSADPDPDPTTPEEVPT